MSGVIAEVCEALASDWSAARLDTLAGKLKSRIGERTARLKAITAKDPATWGHPGPARRKVIDSGDVEALRKLDDEELDLAPELAVLHDLQKKLRARLDQTLARESAEGMPDTYSALRELLADEAKKQDAARKARQATEAKLQEIVAQRRHVIRQNANGQKLDLPAAPPDLQALYMRIHGYTYHRGPERIGWFSPTGGPQQLQKVAEALGLPVPRPEAMAA